jgi:hypothetical protein
MINYDFFNTQNNCKVINGQLAILYTGNSGKMPLIKKQQINLENFRYIGFQNIKKQDTKNAISKTVGYFLQDYKFEGVRRRPWNYTERLRQYKQVLSPDFSCYSDMSKDEQWVSIFLNRLIGAYWQKQGLFVIPTVTWGGEKTFEFCFDGVEKESIVAISTIGTSKNRAGFMAGFIRMCEMINPEKVICYCTPYPDMYLYADILVVEHEGSRVLREVKNRPIKGQLSLDLEVD